MLIETISIYFRESIAALIHSGQRADHPVYLSDLGAALTSAEGAEQQAVMEEMNVRFLIIIPEQTESIHSLIVL